MKEIKTRDRDINIYGTNFRGNGVVTIDGVNFNELGIDKTKKYEFVVMEYNGDYAVFTDFFVSDVIGNIADAIIACEYDEEIWFEENPDKEDLAVEMI